MSNVYCNDHVNGFQHYSDLLREFHGAIKFEEKESDEYYIDPGSGVKVWCDPYLALYVSARRLGSLQEPQVLHYGLTRAKWQHIDSTTEHDRQYLLELARSKILEDLKQMTAAGYPPASKKPVML